MADAATQQNLQTEYAAYIASRTRDFTGREWVFRKIDEWLTDADSDRIFLLTGGPGTGKTAVAARLAQMSLGEIDAASYPALGKDSLAYFHFCQAGLVDTISPPTFVQSFAQSLADRYPAFRVALATSGSRAFVVNQTVGNVQTGGKVIGLEIGQARIEIKSGDARPLFDQAVRLPLVELCKQTTEKIVILIDSLDEALTFNVENNITQLLKLVGDFPRQVRFFLTCRSNREDVFDIVGRPTLDLIVNADPGLDEVRTYAAVRLQFLPEPKRSVMAARIAEKSNGNFLYAYHVLNDFIKQGPNVGDMDTVDLPDALEDVYRKFLEREMASSTTRWNDVYRPLLGPIAVARGDGLTKSQLIGITDLAEDTATTVLNTCAQYLVGGGSKNRPYRIYHQSFRDFLISDTQYSVFPADRHAAIARYLQDEYGSSWSTCNNEYALRYTPVHWADSATLSAVKRGTRTQTLIGLTTNPKYQRRFEGLIGELNVLHDYLERAVAVAALNERVDMLPWIVKAARGFASFRRDYLRAESVVQLAEQGKLEQAERRLSLFSDIDEDWHAAARLVIAWLGNDQNKTAAQQLYDDTIKNMHAIPPLPLLRDRVKAALASQTVFPFEEQAPLTLELGQQLVKRVSGQEFNRELLGSINPSLIAKLGAQSQNQIGYAANFDGPVLVNIARQFPTDGTDLLDQYVEAHAGYNYVEYRNRSLWMVLHAVLRHHPDQAWVKARLRHMLAVALSGGGVDFTEMLPLTAALLSAQTGTADPRPKLDAWRWTALRGADALQQRRGANDSWGNHKRRLTALMEMYRLLLDDANEAQALLNRIMQLPDGFAGFQAPAKLRLVDAIRACRLDKSDLIDKTLRDALRSAHHIQDYHFCARITARCNALSRWHHAQISGSELLATIQRFVRSPFDREFAADHMIHEPYQYREIDGDTLSIDEAQQAETMEQLMEVFQRPAVEFRRLNPQYTLSEKLADRTPVSVPDPGFPPLLAVHLAARTLADDSVSEERAQLIRMLVPVAVNNPTALDTALSYLLIAAKPEDPELMEEIVKETGPVTFADVAAPVAQIGPDAATPT